MQALHHARISPSGKQAFSCFSPGRPCSVTTNAYVNLQLSQVDAMSAPFQIAIHSNVGDVTTLRIKKSIYIFWSLIEY